MSAERETIVAAMRALVGRLGCYDAAAETINARWGGGSSKGTLSKKLAGQLDFTVADVIALEDSIGSYPITNFLARRLGTASAVRAGSLIEDGSAIAKEAGEAVGAILTAATSASDHQKADAIQEIDEAIEALHMARKRLEGGAE